MPIVEEDIDGLSGLLFPFYDADTHMLYLAGKVSADHCRKICCCLTDSVYLHPTTEEREEDKKYNWKKALFRFSFGVLI